MALKSTAGTSELIAFGVSSGLRRNYTLRRNFPAGTWKFTSFWRKLGSPLGMKIPGYSLLGIPLFFCWHLRINSFWFQLISLLKLSRWHLVINYVWRQLGSPLGFSIPVYSFSGIPPCFPPLGFTLNIRSCGTTFSPVRGLLLFSFLGGIHQSPKDKIAYVPLYPVFDHVHILDLNTRLRVG